MRTLTIHLHLLALFSESGFWRDPKAASIRQLCCSHEQYVRCPLTLAGGSRIPELLYYSTRPPWIANLLTSVVDSRNPFRPNGPASSPIHSHDLWLKFRSAKDATFMWSIWHNALAIHSWRAKIATNIDVNCKCCMLTVEETPFHRFFSCIEAQDAWDYAQSILYHIRGIQLTQGPHHRLTFL